MISDLYKYLRDNITAIDGRIYPTIMPQNTTKPAMVYTVVTNGDKQYISGCTNQEIRFQLDIYGTSYSEVQSILTEVKGLLYAYKLYPQNFNSRDGYVEDQELFRQIIDFKLVDGAPRGL